MTDERWKPTTEEEQRDMERAANAALEALGLRAKGIVLMIHWDNDSAAVAAGVAGHLPDDQKAAVMTDMVLDAPEVVGLWREAVLEESEANGNAADQDT